MPNRRLDISRAIEDYPEYNRMTFHDRIVYVVGPIEGFYKIGVSNNVLMRMKSLGLPVVPKLNAVIETDNPFQLESYLHVCFHSQHQSGEWFWLTADDVQVLKSIKKANSLDDMPQSLRDMYDASVFGDCEFNFWKTRLSLSKKFMSASN